MNREENVAKFAEVYEKELATCVQEAPAKYTYGLDAVPGVAARMKAAFLAGTYNHDGLGVRRTCKVLGIKPTRRAIEAFFEGGS